MTMNYSNKDTPSTPPTKTQAASTSKSLWSSLSDNQQESLNGGWPKIKWPFGGGSGGGNNA